jgi:hypothetical protein
VNGTSVEAIWSGVGGSGPVLSSSAVLSGPERFAAAVGPETPSNINWDGICSLLGWHPYRPY